MPVAGVRKYEVVHRGIGQHQSREKPRPGPLLPQCSSQSPQRQYRRCQERRGAEVHRSKAAGWSGNTIPIVEETFQADDCETRRVRAEPIERHPLARLRISEFAHLPKLFELKFVEI